MFNNLEVIMKQRLLSLAVLSAFTVASAAAVAAPVKLTKMQMDKVVAGANPHEQTITTNNGGVSGAGQSCSNGQTCNTFSYKTTGKP